MFRPISLNIWTKEINPSGKQGVLFEKSCKEFKFELLI
jgi:hypothetical protein